MLNASSAMPTDPRNQQADTLVYYRYRDPGALISEGFHYVRRYARTLIRPLVVICIPVIIVGSVFLGNFVRTFATTSTDPVRGLLFMLGGYLLLILAYILGSVVICEHMRYTMLHGDQAPTLAVLWRECRSRIWTYLGISLLTSLISGMGSMLILPWFFLVVVFQFSYPLHAFERASLGDCIGRAFSLVWGRWWVTAILVLALTGMILVMNSVVDVPIWLITSFLTISGLEGTGDPDEITTRGRVILTLISLVGSSVYMLMLPFLQVPICFHVLSTTELKEAPGLMQEVNAFKLDEKA
jgi:hypothetical protein